MSVESVIQHRRAQHVWHIASSIITIAVLVFAVLLVGLRVFGLQIYTVMSGSMEPKYPVGSLIYTKSVAPESLKAGDVITFMNDETTIVTHRIDEVLTEANPSGEEVLKFRTKGDANATTDGKLVHYKNVLGTPVFAIPFLGYISFYLQSPPGIYITLIIGTCLVMSIIIPSVIKRKERIDQKSKATS